MEENKKKTFSYNKVLVTLNSQRFYDMYRVGLVNQHSRQNYLIIEFSFGQSAFHAGCKSQTHYKSYYRG